MYKSFALSLTLAVPLACSGASESNHSTGGSAGQGGHESSGRGGAGATGAAGTGAHGGGAGTGAAGAGSGGATGGAGHAGAGGSTAGAGAAGNAGVGGSNAGAGAAGNAGVGGSNAGAGGMGTTGAAGESGAAGSGERCGGRSGMTCDSGQYCKFEGGICDSADEIGTCTTQPAGVTCVQGYVCGCDGKVYSNVCMAHLSGVDIWDGNPCVPGDGMQGDPCLVDDDCSSGLKCCSSPIQVISCTAPMGTGCPLTP